MVCHSSGFAKAVSAMSRKLPPEQIAVELLIANGQVKKTDWARKPPKLYPTAWIKGRRASSEAGGSTGFVELCLYPMR